MNAIVPQSPGIPALIDRAATALASARSSAEVLEARDLASAAYDAAKRAARFAKAKDAHDTVIQAAYRAQADALEIETQAKRRLADEYDAAQERGEVRTRADNQHVPDQNKLTVEEIGLTSKQIHEARQIRDAEEAEPGIVRRVLDEKIERGEEPTKAAVNAAIVNRTSFTGNNEWFTPAEVVERARAVLGAFDVDPASNEIAQQTVRAATFFTEGDSGLEKEWHGRVWLNPPYAQPAIGQFIDKLVAERESARAAEAIALTHNYTDTAWFQKAARAANAICFTRGRIRFVAPNGTLAAPTQGQAFFYFGNNVDRFAAVFADVGFLVEVR